MFVFLTSVKTALMKLSGKWGGDDGAHHLMGKLAACLYLLALPPSP